MLITDVTRRGQRELARLLGLRARLGRRAGLRTRSRRSRYVVSGDGRAAARRRPVPVRRGPGRCTSRRASGTRSRTRASEDVVMVFGFPSPGLPADRAPRGLMAATAQSLREQVAWACRILALEGYADLTLGHVSARPDGRRHRADQAQGRRARRGRRRRRDRARPLARRGARSTPEMHLEAVLHTEVYKARPDVGAVVHGHPPFVTAFAATGATLEMLTHDSVLFADGLAVFEETPELITEVGRGQGRRRGARRQARGDPAQPRRARRRQERALGRADAR